MIPAAATAVVSGENLEKIATAFPNFLAKKGLTGEIKETASENGNCLKISLEGVSAHASVPWEGKNGACLLASFLRDFPFTVWAKNFLDFAGDLELEDYYGEKIGIANTDSEMGKSINCPAVFRCQMVQAGATVISAEANYDPFFKNGVGYGPAFPDSLDTAHAIDESVSLAELEKSLAIYAEAIYELTK